jgi:hypothetical protein
MKRTILPGSTLLVFTLISVLGPTALAGGRHRTTVTLQLTGSLTAKGTVRVGDGTQACRSHRDVLIQKRGGGGGWMTVGRGESHPNGTYSISIPDASGSYRTFVKKLALSGQGVCTSATSRIVQPPTPPNPPSDCTNGYSPCLIYHGGADYDCYGGGGNGPYFTAPGVTYRVTGSDPYGLDGDNDGYGCE